MTLTVCPIGKIQVVTVYIGWFICLLSVSQIKNYYYYYIEFSARHRLK